MESLVSAVAREPASDEAISCNGGLKDLGLQYNCSPFKFPYLVGNFA
jgi:hypothetical protein